jgi:glycosyltransferase involved in cell wall biosynthesis
MEEMRILVVNTYVPFVHGGAESHAHNLVQNLRKHGHIAEEVRIPFKWYPPEKIPDHILAVRLFDLTESCGEPVDFVIGLKFPAYFIKHHNKVLWVLHQYKQAYELWKTQFSDLHGKTGVVVREAIIKADNAYLPEARKIFSNSKTVSNRLKTFNNIDSEPLYHPPPHQERLYVEDYSNFIFYPSRLNEMKRQHLAIEAMRFVKSDIKLIISGSADSSHYEKRLRDMVHKYNLQDRVKLIGYISEKEKIELYANALAVLFIPYDEDYGYVTLEAFYSKKPVITCIDSGGPLEFVKNKYTGLVCEPNPESLSNVISYLANNKVMSQNLGKEAYEFINSLNISWDNVIEVLTS